MNVLSLFSGVGGLDLGLERAGMQIVAHSEVDEYACRVLEKHWPGVPNLGDITQIQWHVNSSGETEAHIPVGQDEAGDVYWDGGIIGNVEVICGGFPCQDISLAGKGAGIEEGTRSGLWTEYARCVRDVGPRYVIVENVAALTSRGLDRVLRDLAALGYGAWWDCVPAASVGAPHLRDRVFVVATRSDVAPFDTDTSPMQWASEQRSEPNGDTTGADPDSYGERGNRSAAEHGADGGTQPAGDNRAGSDADDAGRIKQRRPQSTPPQQPATQRRDSLPNQRRPTDHPQRRRHGNEDEAIRAGRETNEPASWWAAEPGVGRVAPRIPRRVDRLRCLGNAVVPQVAEYVGVMVMDHAKAVAA